MLRFRLDPRIEAKLQSTLVWSLVHLCPLLQLYRIVRLHRHRVRRVIRKVACARVEELARPLRLSPIVPRFISWKRAGTIDFEK